MNFLYKELDENKLEISYQLYPLNIVALLSALATIILMSIGLKNNIGISEDLFINIIAYILILIILNNLIFKHIFRNLKKTISFSETTIEINRKERLNVNDGDIRFVLQNLTGRYGDTILTRCYLEQGFGIKQKRINLASMIFEYDGILLSKFFTDRIKYLELVKRKGDRMNNLTE